MSKKKQEDALMGLAKRKELIAVIFARITSGLNARQPCAAIIAERQDGVNSLCVKYINAFILYINEDGKINWIHHADDSKLFINQDVVYAYLLPALLAISFLHCKNVSVVSHKPEKLQGKRLSRHKPHIKYKTLQIEPMKKILRDEGRVEETGIKLALHICRGHFKDYSKGQGLFGRYKDMFWWESQVRGSGEQGVVLKDYNVNEPKTDL